MGKSKQYDTRFIVSLFERERCRDVKSNRKKLNRFSGTTLNANDPRVSLRPVIVWIGNNNNHLHKRVSNKISSSVEACK